MDEVFRVLRDEDGAPIAGALVGLGTFRQATSEGTLRTSLTDADGNATLAIDDLAYHAVLYVCAPGRRPSSASAHALADLPRSVRLLPGTTFAGTVRDDAGRSIEGGDVELVIEGPNWIGNGPGCQYGKDHWPLCRTDRDGRFAFDWFDAQWCGRDAVVGLRFTDPEHTPRVVRIDNFVHFPGVHRLDATLATGFEVRGRVLDHRDAPVSATVDVYSRGGREQAMSAYDHKKVVTAHDGSFWVFGLCAGPHEILASARGSAVTRLTVDPVQTPKVTVRLRRGSSVRGIAYDKEGAPRAGCEVIAANTWRQLDRRAVTDADGRFCIDGLPRRGKIVLRVHADTNLVVRLPSPPVDLRPRLVALTVRMVDRSGRPLPKTGVSVVCAGFGTGLITDTEGEAKAMLPPGWYMLDAFVADQGASTRFFRLRSDASACALTMRLTRGRALRGRVLGPTGTPLAGCRVLARHQMRHQEQHETTSCADGTFALSHLRGGYWLTFDAAGCTRRTVWKRVGRFLPLVPRMTVRLSDAAQRHAVS